MERCKNLQTQGETEDAVVECETDHVDPNKDRHNAEIIKNINKTLIVLFAVLNTSFYIVYFSVKYCNLRNVLSKNSTRIASMLA